KMCLDRPRPSVSITDGDRRSQSGESSRYLISTFAPAASIFFLISSASSFVTPSLSVLGAPSTSALASARPSPGTAPRTSLITAILFEPISFKITSKVVFSSAAGAAAAPAAAGPAAIATGAAALTPHFSSSCLTNPAISSTDRLLSCSTNLSVSAISYFLQFRCRKNSLIRKANFQRGDLKFSRKHFENFGHGRHIILASDYGCLPSQVLARIRKT